VQDVRSPKLCPKSASLSSDGDDSLSPLPFQYPHVRCSSNEYESATGTLPTAPEIFRPIYGDLIAPSLTLASLHEYGDAAATLSSGKDRLEPQSMATYRSASPLSLLRQQTQLCKPLTGYNYFYRDEKNNIVQHLQQHGDPLPDPVCDFSAHKMDELLHQRWYVFSAAAPQFCWNETPSSQPEHLRSAGTLTLPKERDRIKRVTGKSPLKSKPLC
jgi:hypothetical protein